MTHGGNSGGACCHFPFILHNSVYDRCTKSGRNNKIWCATTVDYDRDHQWGYCQGKRSWDLVFLSIINSTAQYGIVQDNTVPCSVLQYNN